MSTRRPIRIAIIGGGITGLSAAWNLEQQACADRPLEISLFEASPRLGGKIATRFQDGLTLELGAESFLSRKPDGIGLCHQLGIHEQLRGTRPENKRTFVWWNGRLHRLPEGLTGFVPGNLFQLFSSSLLTASGKLRTAFDLFLPSRKRDGDESVAHFISRRLGKQAYERLVQPLMCGIYCADGEQLSLAATFPELRKLEQQFGSLIRGLRFRQQQAKQSASGNWPPFVTFPGGMSDLIDSIYEKLKITRIQLSSPVESLCRKASSWHLKTQNASDDDPAGNFDAIIVATSSRIAAKILSTSCPELSNVLASIPHVSTATVNLWYDSAKLGETLNGYGFVIPSSQRLGITAVTWTSSKHYDRAPGEKKLIRVFVGRAGAELDPTTPDDEILAIVRQEITRTMGIKIEPIGYFIQRWPHGSPQYTLGHLEKLQRIDCELQSMPGLQLCGSSYRGVGIPDCIGDGKLAANNVFRHILENENELQ